MARKDKMINEFVKAFIDKLGVVNAKLILSSVEKKSLLELIRESQAKGLNMDQAVVMLINTFAPPRVTITFELIGIHEDVDDIKEAVWSILQQCKDFRESFLIEATVNSMVPFMDDRLIFKGCGSDQCVGCNGDLVAESDSPLHVDSSHLSDLDKDKLFEEAHKKQERDNWAEEWFEKFQNS